MHGRNGAYPTFPAALGIRPKTSGLPYNLRQLTLSKASQFGPNDYVMARHNSDFQRDFLLCPCLTEPSVIFKTTLSRKDSKLGTSSESTIRMPAVNDGVIAVTGCGADLKIWGWGSELGQG